MVLAPLPEEVQPKLKQLQKAIKEAVPHVEEKISYSMPYYGYKGRFAYFAYAKNHVGLYLMPPLIAENKALLTDYTTSTATIQFPLDKDLPMPLIHKLLKIAVSYKDEKKK